MLLLPAIEAVKMEKTQPIRRKGAPRANPQRPDAETRQEVCSTRPGLHSRAVRWRGLHNRLIKWYPAFRNDLYKQLRYANSGMASRYVWGRVQSLEQQSEGTASREMDYPGSLGYSISQDYASISKDQGSPAKQSYGDPAYDRSQEIGR